jgi:hypothetical protein
LLDESVGVKAVIGAGIIILGVLTSELGGILMAKFSAEKRAG